MGGEVDGNRYIVQIPKELRAKIYPKLKRKSLDLGGTIKVEVKKKGVFSVSFPGPEPIASFQSIVEDSGTGIIFEQDHPRYLTDILKSSSLRASRNLAETVPWGIEKIYEDNGVPSAGYYSGLNTKKI